MAEQPQKRSLGEIWTAVGAIATVLCFLAALVVVPEFRRASAVGTLQTEISDTSGGYDRQVKKLIAAKLKVVPERVTDNARLVKDLHADEIDMVELVGSLEDSFEVGHISDLDSVDLVTVKDVVKYVESHVPKKAATKPAATKPAATKPAATKQSSIERVDWHDKQNWRKFLHSGMTQSEVRQLFGEPEKMEMAGSSEFWGYGGGRIQFADGALYAWFEPGS